VNNLHNGQRVIPFTSKGRQSGNGSFQKFVCIDADFVWPVPDYLSDEVAAQFVINPWTSYSLLKDLQVPKGEYVVQSAAGSTLGKQVILLAKHYGIKTINVVRRAEQRAELKALGADEVICSSDEDVMARVKAITGGKGAWGALDAVCGASTGTLASCVRDGGQVFLYGMLAGFVANIGAGDLFRGVSVTGWAISNKITNNPKKCQALAPEVAPLVRDGVIPVAEVEKHDLADFKMAMAKAEEPGRSVRILLVSE
jgi:trans-2-enoyl-CoA reductase